MCTSALPEGIDKDASLIILVVNVIAPGVGTLIASCLATKCQASTVFVGIAQLITSFIIVGWIWAIIWSVGLSKKVDEDQKSSPKETVPEGEQPQSPPPAVVSPPAQPGQPYAPAPPAQPGQPYAPAPPAAAQQPYPPYATAPAPSAGPQQPYPPVPPAGPQQPYEKDTSAPPPYVGTPPPAPSAP